MVADGRREGASEVVNVCRDLIRINTTNTGDAATTVGESVAAEYVAAALADVGLTPRLYESAPGRVSVVARFAGTSPGRPALLLHSHLDVVPAEAGEWRFDPFSGEIADGYLWGRGAIDMKHFAATMLTVVRRWRGEGRKPPRDLVLAFLADEEAGGTFGAHFMIDKHPEAFAGCEEAVGEVGGFSFTLDPDNRLYLIETAQKGLAWARLRTEGRPGHGSMAHDDNAIVTLADALARLGRHRFPVEVTATVRSFLEHVAHLTGTRFDPNEPDATIDRLGPLAKLIGATIRDTANPTRLAAGYKDNVIPGQATASVDCRFLPGRDQAFDEELRAVLGPGIDIEYPQRQPAIETTFDGPLVEAMTAALRAEDPGAHPVPYMLSAGTDAKAFARLGMRCFGFTPLRLPSDLDFAALFHGIDERVPLDGLEFGVQVFDRFLRSC